MCNNAYVISLCNVSFVGCKLWHLAHRWHSAKALIRPAAAAVGLIYLVMSSSVGQTFSPVVLFIAFFYWYVQPMAK